jgi:phosphoribosylamine--glycine ligase
VLVCVGQIVNLRPIGNRPVHEFGIIYGPITNRPQVTNLPHKERELKILVIGAGGREHALCWKLAQSPQTSALYAAPGNPGIAEVATCLATTAYLAAAESIDADLTVVGPEAPLAAGIVDQFRSTGRRIFGPTAAAARLEASKTFAKDLMLRAGIPTARHATVDTLEQARIKLRDFELPVVLKADGLAAGKGVIIANSHSEAEQGIAELLTPGSTLVIEEFLTGEEVSFIVLSDGIHIMPLEPTQDHKAVFDGDTGPNTGGMGAYCDGRILSDFQKALIMVQVIEPTIAQMRAEGHPFTGFLYAGLMMTSQGPKVLEFNARLGDPETQVLMHRMESDFVEPLYAATEGQLEELELKWRTDPSVCVVLAAAGYPGSVRSADKITGLNHVESATVFHAGTKQANGDLVTSGGRVLGVTASGPTLSSAIHNTYQQVKQVHFDGMHYRKDIGQKGLKRW